MIKLNFFSILFLFMIINITSCNKFNMQDGINYYRATKYKDAFYVFVSLAEKGNPRAQFNIAVMYYQGQGVKQDYKQAFKYFMLATNKNIPMAEYMVGEMYANGKGVQKSSTKAAKFIISAAHKESISAQIHLALIYLKMNKIKKAKLWLEKAKKNGISKQHIDIFYKYVELFKKSPKEADSYLQKPLIQNKQWQHKLILGK